MIRPLQFVIALVASAVCGFAMTVNEQLRFGRQSSRPLRGWGFTIAPTDWDGIPMLRDHRQLGLILQDMKPDVLRFTLGSTDIPWISENDTSIAHGGFDQALGRYIKEAMTAGVPKYTISFTTPPKWMKHYYSDYGHIYLDPNGIRSEYISIYALLVAKLMQHIHESGLTLPYGISIQEAPDIGRLAYGCPPSLAQACLYRPLAYKSVVRQCREFISLGGFAGVKMLGPETYGSTGFEDYDCPYLDSVLVSAMTAVKGLERDRELWLVGSTPWQSNSATTEVVAVFEELQRDIVDFATTYWLWPYGYTPDDTGDGLFFGRDVRPTTVGKMLRLFWREVEPGACSFEIVVGQTNKRVGFGLRMAKKKLLVVINDSPDPREYDMEYGPAKVSILSSGTPLALEDSWETKSRGSVAVPAFSVALVVIALQQ